MARKGRRRAAGKRTPSARRARAGARAAARSGARARRTAKARRNTRRRTAGARTPKGKARKTTRKAPKAAMKRKTARNAASRKTSAPRKKTATARKKTRLSTRRAGTRPRGGTGREREMAQTPDAGRTVRGPVNLMPTKRSTGTPAGAGSSRHAPALERERRQLREVDETVPGPPSSLDFDRSASAARTGRAEMREARHEHTETSPALTGGDVDADWKDAYAVGDEAVGGDNPTPDQDRVDDLGKALGVQYEDAEELKSSDKISQRDRHRWELDPASSEDYKDRD